MKRSSMSKFIMAQAKLLSLCMLLALCIILVKVRNVEASKDVVLHFRTNSSNDILNDAKVEIGSTFSCLLEASGQLNNSVSLELGYDTDKNTTSHSDQVSVDVSKPSTLDSHTIWLVNIHGEEPGHATLVLTGVKDKEQEENSTHSYNVSNAYIRLQIYHSEPLDIVSQVIGWIYFAAWSVSFYPQVYLNWRRKSVIGLNFDFLGLNLVGFLCYTAYNVGLFWIPTVEEEYRERNPHDIVPVEINDVVFAIHAVAITSITIMQVFIYERGDQRVSMVTRVILALCGGAILIFIIIAAVPSVKSFNWLDMLSAFSYVKLGITIIKYIPQAWMNFRRKSTVGWSIGNVLLDFTGGTGSIIQMFMNAYNYNDWKSIFLNPVKFWLGALSIIFDVIFIVQHYCLYRHARTYDYSDLVTNGNSESDK